MLEKALINSTVDSVITKLKGNHRISGEEIDQLKNVFSSQDLVIGVVGKMKAGKSSLVNASVFADNVLPSGSQPVTVTLTEISYSEKDEVEIVLLSSEDIADLKEKAAYNGEDALLIEMGKNAQDTLKSFPPEYEKLIVGNNLLHAKLTELEDFVSASGKYSGLAKQVTIKINNDNLKGITIVDTPGFNDPISSRGETTRKCLSKCNVILFVHNEDGYDQTDEELLKEQIEYAGISDMVDIFNKVDLLGMPFSEWDDQKAYYIEKKEEYIEKLPENSDVRGIAEKSEAILTSSLMALCGQIKSEKRSNWIKMSRATYEEDYDEFCNLPEGVSLDEQLVRYSNINAVISEINRIARNSANYLLEAPLKTLKGKLGAVIELVNSEMEESKNKIASYETGIKSTNKEIDDFEKYGKDVLAKIESYPLEDRIQTRINQSFTALCSSRSKMSTSEFSKDNYPEPSVMVFGIKKQNVGRYNLCVSNFEDIIRDELNDLLNSLKSIVKEYVGEITMMLVEGKISEENRKIFKQGLINELSGKLSQVIVAIVPNVIDEVPSGQQMHWSLFKTKFEKTFSDSYLSQLLNDIRQVTSCNNGICDPSIPKYKVVQFLNDLKATLALSPEQKEQAKNVEVEKKNALEKEINTYEEFMKTITELLKQ